MNKCSGCKKLKEETCFLKNGKVLKKCKDCRDLSNQWKSENKERVKQYNKMSNDNRYNQKIVNENRKQTIILAKKQNTDEWIKFDTQADAAKQLNLQNSNISKVLNGKLKHTGGYVFKKEEIERDFLKVSTWDEIKQEHYFEHKQVGQPAKHRIQHEKIDGEMGKVCCTCKLWRPLSDYNGLTSHWDSLRNDCKMCLSTWRKEHRPQLNANQNRYFKERRAKDSLFKLILTMRTRLGCALRAQNISKRNTTIKYLGCSIPFLKRYIEVQFRRGMNWYNHGNVWDIDHIVPISYKTSETDNEDEILSRFHWSNCQPMWRSDNMSKQNKYISFHDNIALSETEYIKYNSLRLLLIFGRIGLCWMLEYKTSTDFLETRLNSMEL